MNITVTGVDERTEFGDIRALHAAGAEVAVLLSFRPEDRHRYPSVDWIKKVTAAVPGRWALHVCGGPARIALLAGQLDFLAAFQRIQVNGDVAQLALSIICCRYPHHTIITQASNGNPLDVSLENHAVLVDASGGRGISPRIWTRPQTPRNVGFAGGLGPHNLEQELPRIAAVATGDWWIDMEQRLRDSEDWFSAFSAKQCCDIVHQFSGASADGI